MSPIYHITSREAAQAARQNGEYRAESLASQGFIHFSQLHQLLGVANAFYKGNHNQVILVVDPDRLTSELKYEAPVHPSMVTPDPDGAAERSMVIPAAGARGTAPTADQRFPHLYGPLNFEAVTQVVDLPVMADGSFVLPAM